MTHGKSKPIEDRLKTADAGRDAGGRFTPGNPGGPGNPNAGAVSKARAAFLAALRDEDVITALQTIRDVMGERHKAGERLAAAEAMLDRTIGKPAMSDLLERVEKLEELLAGREAEDAP